MRLRMSDGRRGALFVTKRWYTMITLAEWVADQRTRRVRALAMRSCAVYKEQVRQSCGVPDYKIQF